MTSKFEIKWVDIVSPTMTPDDYLTKFKDKIEFNYKTYEPKSEILQQIEEILDKNNDKLKIIALGADWCPDCNKNVPRMIKVVKSMKNNLIEFRILYGIMVNALHKPGESLWHKTRSPPEASDPRFDLQAIPTFYFFDVNGQFIGIIKEHPKLTIEEDILEILKTSQ